MSQIKKSLEKVCNFGNKPNGLGCTLFECKNKHPDGREISNMLCCKKQGYCINGNRCLKKHVSIVEFACENGINCPYKKCRDAHPICNHDNFCTREECLQFDFLINEETIKEEPKEIKKEQPKEIKKEKKEKKKEKKETNNKKNVPEKQNISVKNSYSALEDTNFPPVSSKISNSNSNSINLQKSFSQVLGKNNNSKSKGKQTLKVSSNNPVPKSSTILSPAMIPKPNPITKEYTIVIDTISSKILIEDLQESKIKERLRVSKQIRDKSKLEWNLTFKGDIIEVVPKSEWSSLSLRKESVPLELKDGSDTVTEMMNIDLPNDYDDILTRMHAISNWLRVNNYSDECVSSYDSNNNMANATLI